MNNNDVSGINVWLNGDIFGDEDPNDLGINVSASIEKYREMVDSAIEELYPSANVWVTAYGAHVNDIRVHGDFDFDYLSPVDHEKEHEAAIDGIIADVWNSWEWVVHK